MGKKVNLVIHGVESSDEIPGIDRITDYVEISCAPDLDSMQRCLPKAEVLLGWNFRAKELRDAWYLAEVASATGQDILCRCGKTGTKSVLKSR